MIDAGSVLGSILRHDNKSTSYKIALPFPDMGHRGRDVAVPLRVLIEFWRCGIFCWGKEYRLDLTYSSAGYRSVAEQRPFVSIPSPLSTSFHHPMRIILG
jgi:hypothetical protein